MARYLFVPLAEAVVFAMLASYVLSRTLVPTLAMYLLRPRAHHPAPTRNPFALLQRGFERGFERTRAAYRELLTRLISRQGAFVVAFLAACLSAWLLLPWLGENFFPASDNGQFILHLRAKTGTRIEETARLADLVETVDPARDPARGAGQHHRQHRPAVLAPSTTCTAAPASSARRTPTSWSPSRRGTGPPRITCADLRARLPQEFPGVAFYFVPADIVTQILNFGLPAPIDVQIEGSDLEGNRQVANQILDRAAARARAHRPAHPAELRLPELPGERGPHQGGGGRLHASATWPTACC